MVLVPANLHINGSFPVWRVGDSRVTAAHKARQALACRPITLNFPCDALLTCVFLLSRADTQRPVEKPWSRSSSNSRDHCGLLPAREGRYLLPTAFPWPAPRFFPSQSHPKYELFPLFLCFAPGIRLPAVARDSWWKR